MTFVRVGSVRSVGLDQRERSSIISAIDGGNPDARVIRQARLRHDRSTGRSLF